MPDDDATREAPTDVPAPTTEINPADTAGVAPLAYSDHTTSMPVIEYQPQQRRRWIGMLVLAMGLAAAIAAYTFGHHRGSTDTIVTVPSPTTSTTAQPAQSPEQRQDAVLFALLDKYRISYVHREDAISTARSVCAALDNGQTFGSLETALIESAGDGVWGVRDSDQFLDASIEAYCPQYRDLVPPESLQGPFDGSLRESADGPSMSSVPSAPAATPNASPSPAPVAVPPPAAASPSADERFLSTLDTGGIGYTNRAGQIGQGRQVCAALDGGESYQQLFGEMNGTAWSAGIIRAAVGAYCPSHANLLP